MIEEHAGKLQIGFSRTWRVFASMNTSKLTTAEKEWPASRPKAAKPVLMVMSNNLGLLRQRIGLSCRRGRRSKC
jgi:hypothetical protein